MTLTLSQAIQNSMEINPRSGLALFQGLPFRDLGFDRPCCLCHCQFHLGIVWAIASGILAAILGATSAKRGSCIHAESDP